MFPPLSGSALADTALAYFSYDPIQAFRIFGLPMPSPHGIGAMVGFILGAVICSRRAVARGLDKDQVSNTITWGAIGAIIGTRGFYVLAHLDQYDSLFDAINVLQGGLTLFGGLVGGLTVAIIYMWRHKMPLRHALDAAAPGLVIGIFVGRIGDLVIADHLGRTTDFFLGYLIKASAELAPGYGPPVYVPGAVVHQAALYDLIGVVFLGAALALVATRAKRPGVLFATFAFWYGVQRILIDFTRNREVIESFFFGFSGSQWAGAMFAVIGLVGLVFLPRQRAAQFEPMAVGPRATDFDEAAAANHEPKTEPDPMLPELIWNPATGPPALMAAPERIESES